MYQNLFNPNCTLLLEYLRRIIIKHALKKEEQQLALCL
jgi:hypothetical protein